MIANLFINDYRLKSRSPVSLDVDGIDDNFLYHQFTILGLGKNPEQQFFSNIIDGDVRKAIEESPDDFKMVVVLSFLEGFFY